MVRYLKQECLPRGQWVIVFCLVSLALAPSFSLSYTFSDSRASAFSQLAGESPRSLDRTVLFSSPQLDGGIKTPSARFIRCSGSAALGRPIHSYFTPAALTLKKLSNEITDRQTERENHKMKH